MTCSLCDDTGLVPNGAAGGWRYCPMCPPLDIRQAQADAIGPRSRAPQDCNQLQFTEDLMDKPTPTTPTTTPWNAADHLDTPQSVQAFITDFLQNHERDPAMLTHALGVIQQAHERQYAKFIVADNARHDYAIKLEATEARVTMLTRRVEDVAALKRFEPDIEEGPEYSEDTTVMVESKTGAYLHRTEVLRVLGHDA